MKSKVYKRKPTKKPATPPRAMKPTLLTFLKNQAAKIASPRQIMNEKTASAIIPPVAEEPPWKAFKAPIKDANKVVNMKTTLPMITAKTHGKNFPPKKQVTPPKTRRRVPKIHG